MAMGGHGGGAAPLRRWCGGAPDALLLFWWACAVVASLPLSPLPLAPGWARRAVRRCSARGKLWQDAAEGGRGLLSAALLDASVPQAWFSHFYLAGSAANAAVLAWVTARWEAGVSPSSDAEGRDLAGQTAVAVVVLGMFQLHVARRLYEAARVAVYRPGARMHAGAYAFGLLYYILVPVSLVPSALLTGFACNPGGPWAPAAPWAAWRAATAHPEWRQWWRAAGLALFLHGSVRQNACHGILADLRRGTGWGCKPRQAGPASPETASAPVAGDRAAGGRRREAGGGGAARRPEKRTQAEPEEGEEGGGAGSGDGGGGGEDGDGDGVGWYRIPRGDWFERVVCPHYLAECVIYLGLLLASGGAPPVCGVFAWVVTNLGAAAVETRRWYEERFEGYPRGRWAMIPHLL